MTPSSAPMEQQVASVEQRLVHEFDGRVSAEAVRALVQQTFAVYAEARVQSFVPVLVSRTVREQLRA